MTSFPYRFKNKALFDLACRHASLGLPHHQRLEFLGDSILGAVIAAHLYTTYPNHDEGILSSLRAQLVNKQTLAQLARHWQVDQCIQYAPSVRLPLQAKPLADTLEALLGAIYLDSDWQTCQTHILTLWASELAQHTPDTFRTNPKSKLQEWCQRHHYPCPHYHLNAQDGPAHQPHFHVHCQLQQPKHTTEASHHNKQQAEQMAAQKMLNWIESS